MLHDLLIIKRLEIQSIPALLFVAIKTTNNNLQCIKLCFFRSSTSELYIIFLHRLSDICFASQSKIVV